MFGHTHFGYDLVAGAPKFVLSGIREAFARVAGLPSVQVDGIRYVQAPLAMPLLSANFVVYDHL